jgi:hypothetical protein
MGKFRYGSLTYRMNRPLPFSSNAFFAWANSTAFWPAVKFTMRERKFASMAATVFFYDVGVDVAVDVDDGHRSPP